MAEIANVLAANRAIHALGVLEQKSAGQTTVPGLRKPGFVPEMKMWIYHPVI